MDACRCERHILDLRCIRNVLRPGTGGKAASVIFSRINYKIEWLAVSPLRQEDGQPFYVSLFWRMPALKAFPSGWYSVINMCRIVAKLSTFKIGFILEISKNSVLKWVTKME